MESRKCNTCLESATNKWKCLSANQLYDFYQLQQSGAINLGLSDHHWKFRYVTAVLTPTEHEKTLCYIKPSVVGDIS